MFTYVYEFAGYNIIINAIPRRKYLPSNFISGEVLINELRVNTRRLLLSGTKYEPSMSNNAYKVHMKLTIKSVGASDYGAYKCISRNSLGETDGTIKVYRKYKTKNLL